MVVAGAAGVVTVVVLAGTVVVVVAAGGGCTVRSDLYSQAPSSAESARPVKRYLISISLNSVFVVELTPIT